MEDNEVHRHRCYWVSMGRICKHTVNKYLSSVLSNNIYLATLQTNISALLIRGKSARNTSTKTDTDLAFTQEHSTMALFRKVGDQGVKLPLTPNFQSIFFTLYLHSFLSVGLI